MIRLYLRVFVILVAVLVAIYINYFTVTVPAEIQANTAMVGELVDQVSALTAHALSGLDDERDRDAVIERARRASTAPAIYAASLDIAVIDRSAVVSGFPELPDDHARALDDGRAAVIASRYDRITLLRAIPDSDQVLVIASITTIPQLPSVDGWWSLIGDLLFIAIGVVVLVVPLYRRIAALRRAARRFSHGEHSARVVVRGRDAIAELAAAFNDMAARTEGLINRQRELTRAVSHEFRTPIARIRFALEAIDSEDDDADRSEQIALVDRDLSELDDLVEEMLTYARLDSRLDARRHDDAQGPGQGDETDLLRLESIDLEDELTSIARRMERASTGDVAIELCMDLADHAPSVRADRRYLVRAIENLIGNSQRHAEARIRVTGRRLGDHFAVVVEDDGPGIPEADRQRIFAPFTRLEGSRGRDSGGTGLGLAIVARISEWHHGEITVDDSDLGGARFYLRWPSGRDSEPA